MTITEATIDVAAPLRTVHGAWHRLEDLAEVLCGIDAIRRIDATHLHVVGRVCGTAQAWDIHITEDTPERRVAWTSTGEIRHDGAVTVEPLSATRTRVTLVLDADDVDAVAEEADPDEAGNRARCDLVRFGRWIERAVGGPDEHGDRAAATADTAASRAPTDRGGPEWQ